MYFAVVMKNIGYINNFHYSKELAELTNNCLQT